MIIFGLVHKSKKEGELFHFFTYTVLGGYHG